MHVIEVQESDPPMVTGWLPRTSLELLVLRAGEAQDPRAEFQGTGIQPHGGIPYRIELVFRPFAFLELGDDVAGADGRAWRFDGPWAWTAYDGGAGLPVWPLTLIENGNGNGSRPVNDGSTHDDEMNRWRRAAGLPA
ncbi:hypothetical protein FB565_006564 [Actinoplanes lutulentus]|uniref:hypothetical protein n=1 Tax=Actinoplanes lutulentus TaxID=1287878 RepID=UPI0011B941A7|nr:hypothetical protein [Actinoplanes lutulentus]MBB2946796.1 hypothetical protein [Actinoplanes lutulentus]